MSRLFVLLCLSSSAVLVTGCCCGSDKGDFRASSPQQCSAAHGSYCGSCHPPCGAACGNARRRLTDSARFSENGLTVAISKVPPATPEVQLCTTCASLTGQALNLLLNYVLQAGVVGGCGKVCGKLKTKTEQGVCTIACGLVGIKAFAAALEKADLDPLYFCDLLHICKHDDGGAGTLDSITVAPLSAAQSTTFASAMAVTVTNHTGAGEFRFDVTGGVDEPSGSSSIYPELAPGDYTVKLSIDTTPASDPTSGGAQWVPGTYSLSGMFCMGECGSKHPHSKLFGKASTNFTITA